MFNKTAGLTSTFTTSKMALMLRVMFLHCFLVLFASTAEPKVIELSDQLLDTRQQVPWLVMMYAPWCGHCQRLEPVWAHVAQHLDASSIQVGRLDCTKYTGTAQRFQVRGFPTILFMKGERVTTYSGDRTHEEIVKFALRLNSPPVQEITKVETFSKIENFLDLYFLYVGEKSGHLWELYHKTAEAFQAHAFFYQAHQSLAQKHRPVKRIPSIIVYKEDTHYSFAENNLNDLEHLNSTLYTWVNAERFATFPKVTRGSINQLFLSEKCLVLAVVEENSSGDVAPDMLKFRTTVESVIKTKAERYHDFFQFGWISNSELLNGLTLMELPKPSLIVVNTTTSFYHILNDNSSTITQRVIEVFLDQVRNDTAVKYGGKGILMQIYRLWFDIKTTLHGMWKGNPILTVVLLGLPSAFLWLICYIICCANSLDSEDKEEDEEDDEEDEADEHPHSQ